MPWKTMRDALRGWRSGKPETDVGIGDADHARLPASTITATRANLLKDWMVSEKRAVERLVTVWGPGVRRRTCIIGETPAEPDG